MLRFLLFLFLTCSLCAPVQAASNLSVAAITRLVEDDLDEHRPMVQIDLAFAGFDAQTQDLERASFLKHVGDVQNDCGVRGQRLLLTEEGQRKAAELGWSAWNGQLDIPLGRLSLSGPVMTSAIGGSNLNAAFRFTILWNDNASYLESLGPASDWPIVTYPRTDVRMLVTGVSYAAKIRILRNRDGTWSVF